MNGEAQKLTWFNDQNVTLEVPFFQRPYVWDEGNWSALIDNIAKSYEGRMPFIGSFIFQQPVKDGKKLLVIDGQQRLTTLSVMIKAFLDIYGQQLGDNIRVTFNSIIYDMQIHGLQSFYVPRLIPSNSDRDGFNLVMDQKSSKEQIEASNHSIAKCYMYFYNRMKEMSDDELIDIGGKLITKEQFFIQITLDSEYDDEQEIFDAVNSLGMRLTSADVIKNYLFQSMKNAVKKQEQDFYSQQIIELYNQTWDKVFYGNDRKDFWYDTINLGRVTSTHIEEFLKDYSSIKGFYSIRENPGSDGLTNAYKQEINKKNYQELQGLVKDISDYAETYFSINHDYEEINDFRISDRLNSTLLVLRKLEHTTFNPYILKLVKDNDPDRDEKLHALQRFVLIRSIYGASTKNYNKVTEVLLKSEDPIAYLDNINKTDPKIDYSKYPEGIDYISPRNNRYATLVLFLIEMILRKDQEDLYSNPLIYSDQLSLEHIIPQKWGENWLSVPCFTYNKETEEYDQVTDLEDIKAIRNRKIFNLGNMTILAGRLNTSISNNIFEIKINGRPGNNNGMKKFVNSMNIASDVIKIYDRKKAFDERDIDERALLLFNVLNEYYNIINNESMSPTVLVTTNKEDIRVLRKEEFTDSYFENTKIGIIVKDAFVYLFSHRLLDDEDLNNLMQMEFSREYLGCALPTIVNKIEQTKDGLGRNRYYAKTYEYKGQVYYLCSEWYADDKKRFIPWFKSILVKEESLDSVQNNGHGNE